MPKTGKQNKRNLTSNTGKLTGWEMAINRAHSHLSKNKVQAAKLRAAIRFFEEELRRGEPWPAGKVFGQDC